MDLSTHYMGLDLNSPIIMGAGPLSADLDMARKAEDNGAGAVIMHSLFEEQITREQLASFQHHTAYADAHAEALSYFPEPERYKLGPDLYLEQLGKLKQKLDIPVIGSLNGVSVGGWINYAKLMEEAGADGIELNIYYVATDPDEDPLTVEKRYVEVAVRVVRETNIPVAVKLSPFFSAPVHMAKLLDRVGVDALVLFNRFYQPDIDIDTLDVSPVVRLSNPHALLLRIRWLAAIFGHVQCSMAATGGVHSGRDAIKALMAGASAVQLTSALLAKGMDQLAAIRSEVDHWMTENEYASVEQMVGSMSLLRCPDPAAFERANYMKVLQSWQPTRTA